MVRQPVAQENLSVIDEQMCSVCEEPSKCRRRDFSEKALYALVFWGDIEREAAQRPICGHCYSDLRDILIEKASEIDLVFENQNTHIPSHISPTDNKNSKNNRSVKIA